MGMAEMKGMWPVAFAGRPLFGWGDVKSYLACGRRSEVVEHIEHAGSARLRVN